MKVARFWTPLPMIASVVLGFVVPHSITQSHRPAFGSKDDEIAELEARLRELREAPPDEVTEKQIQLDERTLEKVRGKDMLLSEAELVEARILEADGGEGSNPLAAIVPAAIGLIAVLLFSQIPIGEEGLSKYSSYGTPPKQTIDLGDLNTDVSRN